LVQYLHNFKNITSSGNLKWNYLGFSQSLKLRILKEKILSISLELNFTPNTLGCYGLKGQEIVVLKYTTRAI